MHTRSSRLLRIHEETPAFPWGSILARDPHDIGEMSHLWGRLAAFRETSRIWEISPISGICQLSVLDWKRPGSSGQSCFQIIYLLFGYGWDRDDNSLTSLHLIFRSTSDCPINQSPGDNFMPVELQSPERVDLELAAKLEIAIPPRIIGSFIGVYNGPCSWIGFWQRDALDSGYGDVGG